MAGIGSFGVPASEEIKSLPEFIPWGAGQEGGVKYSPLSSWARADSKVNGARQVDGFPLLKMEMVSLLWYIQSLLSVSVSAVIIMFNIL